MVATSFLSSCKAVEICQRKGHTDQTTIRTAPRRRKTIRAVPARKRDGKSEGLTPLAAFIVSTVHRLDLSRNGNAETESNDHFREEDGAGQRGPGTELESGKKRFIGEGRKNLRGVSGTAAS